MNLSGKTVLAQLERDILPLQGYKSPPIENYIPIGFPPIEGAFPNARFPRGCLHEFINLSREGTSATPGFITCLLSSLTQTGGVCIYISAARALFPSALKRYGIEPHQVIFIDLKRQTDVLYAICSGYKNLLILLTHSHRVVHNHYSYCSTSSEIR